MERMYQPQEPNPQKQSATFSRGKLVSIVKKTGIVFATIFLLVSMIIAFTDFYHLRIGALLILFTFVSLVFAIFVGFREVIENRYWDLLDVPTVSHCTSQNSKEKIQQPNIFMHDEDKERKHCNHILKQYGLRIDTIGRIKAKLATADDITIERIEFDRHQQAILVEIYHCKKLIAVIEYKNLKYTLTVFTGY